MPNKICALRRQAFVNQGGCCFYCTLKMWEDDPVRFAEELRLAPRLARWLQCTAEHLVARQDGGKNAADNIVAACIFCNRRRHAGRVDKAPDPIRYKARVAKLMDAGRWHPAAQRR